MIVSVAGDVIFDDLRVSLERSSAKSHVSCFNKFSFRNCDLTYLDDPRAGHGKECGLSESQYP